MSNTPKWTGYFKFVSPVNPTQLLPDSQDMPDAGTYANNTWYNRLVQGSASRVARYREYDMMDNDVEVARALDTIAEEMTGNNVKTGEVIDIDILTEEEKAISSTSVLTVKAALRRWCILHDFENSLFNIARVLVKYGDVFFKKIPNRDTWVYVHPKNVLAALVDQHDATKVLGWQIRENFKDAKSPNSGYVPTSMQQDGAELVPAHEIVRFTLNDFMSDTAPFGESVLRPVYRSFKQKELLEDAIIIYRIQRAPERRAFYIDVGKMPPQRVKKYLEGIKNEIRQKRIPTMNGGQAEVDSVYNPNSMGEDFFFATRDGGKGTRVETLPGGCLALDTKIPLLDGTENTLEQIIERYKQGDDLWTYSIDIKTGEICPGKVDWAGITQQSAEVVKLTLDNGQELICTPDHKFPIQGKGYIKAEDITAEDSLFHFEARDHKIASANKSKKYRQVYNSGKNDWEFVHKNVRCFMDSKGYANETLYEELEQKHEVIHHINMIRFDNRPNNLTWMSKNDHFKYHKTLAKKANDIKQQIMRDDPEYKKRMYQKVSESMKDTLANNMEIRKTFVDRIKSVHRPIINTQIQYCDDMLTIVRHFFDNGTIEYKQMIKQINSCQEFMLMWDFINHNKAAVEVNDIGGKNRVHVNKIANEFKRQHLDGLLIQYGYDGWKGFKKDRLQSYVFDGYVGKTDNHTKLIQSIARLHKDVHTKPYYLIEYMKNNHEEWINLIGLYNNISPLKQRIKQGTAPKYRHFDRFVQVCGYNNYTDFLSKKGQFNHKIVKIEKLIEKQAVGTLTIDQKEIYHAHHNFALSVGIFTKNSGLGNLEDLNFFLRKVWRGLRVPASYMIEQNEGGQIWNDGKVGISYIQELRFALFVKRLQSQLENVLDIEFKKFLKAKQIYVDENMYRLRLPDPSNFGQYRQQELDNQLLGSYPTVEGISYISPRFAMKRFLQMTDEEIITNERMRREELGLSPDGGPVDYPKLYSKGEDTMGADGGFGGFGGGGAFDGGLGGAPGEMSPAGEPSGEAATSTEPTTPEPTKG